MWNEHHLLFSPPVGPTVLRCSPTGANTANDVQTWNRRRWLVFVARGKYTATAVHDSDMNTVYLTGLCVHTHTHTHTFHSDLSVNLDPGLPKARKLDCFVTFLFRSDKVLCLGTFRICILAKQQAIDCEFSPNARLSGFGVCAYC